MYIGVFDLFKIGVGPSSSHTMGPMLAAGRFVKAIPDLGAVRRIRVQLFGSLSATGRGHCTDQAVIAGLSGLEPQDVTRERLQEVVTLANSGQMSLAGEHAIAWDASADLIFESTSLPAHPNGLCFTAWSDSGICSEQTFFSIGGGFVKRADEMDQPDTDAVEVPYAFESARTLLNLCRQFGMSISALMFENERVFRTADGINHGCRDLYHAMRSCVDAGLQTQGILPGGLNVRRRAPRLYQSLKSGQRQNMISLGFQGMDWVNLYALAVNEENASGGRMVTAPTNGAAGVIPAVLLWYADQIPSLDQADIVRFFLAAAAVGSLCKQNASISGAEVGCQGEVGSACAMAAAGLCEVLGGTPEQVENAAEIGLEHNLGLTCDPIGGLVQVPCIERNAIAAVKAINAAHLALSGDGIHCVSLDKVIDTLRETGKDMQDKYKETSLGGLAVNAVEC